MNISGFAGQSPQLRNFTLSPLLPEPWSSAILATIRTEGAVWDFHIFTHWKNQTPYMQTSIQSPNLTKFSLYAWIASHLNTATQRHGWIFLSHNTDAGRIWRWLTAFCVCFCASQVSFIEIKLLNSEVCHWSYPIKRSHKMTKAGDAFPPLRCQQQHPLRKLSIQTATANTHVCCLLV